MDLIFALSIICCTLFAILGIYLLFTKKGHVQANRLLGAFFVLWALDFLDGVLLLRGFYLEHPQLAFLTEPFILLYGPLIYLYTLQVIRPEVTLHKRHLLHLIPFILGFCVLLFAFHLQSRAFKLQILQRIVRFDPSIESNFAFGMVYVHIFYYLYLSKKQILKTTKRINEYYSQPKFYWLQKLLNGLIILLVVSIINAVLQFSGNRLYFEIGLVIILFGVGTFIGTFIIKALDQPDLLVHEQLDKKYSLSTLEETDALIIQQAIIKALAEEQLFLNPDITIKDLANNIGYKNRQVSQVINEKMERSFFDLINGYRIEAAKKILSDSDDPKLTILEVMYQVGFNSKSSFNTQFKKKTGVTPSAFLREKH